MKNNLEDLHNHLFAQLERLSDEDLKGDDLKEEINRAKAVSDIASSIVENGKLAITVKRMLGDNEIRTAPKYLEVNEWLDLFIQYRWLLGWKKTICYA
ncbi:hypothetical protein Q5E86_15005 [Providencia sp. CRE-138-0111]|uniref:Phage protein n=2 Tax=Providencia TaxID=586 RepID=A0ABT9ATF0_9GAMM|nr:MULTISPECIES: hypothetical protein [Providencia]MDO7829590.1 hypothetical protein [Providencia sp. CRE-138-0026]MDO7857628.1 hypothetical protein [Providencia sp. CRE-138-0111]